MAPDPRGSTVWERGLPSAREVAEIRQMVQLVTSHSKSRRVWRVWMCFLALGGPVGSKNFGVDVNRPGYNAECCLHTL